MCTHNPHMQSFLHSRALLPLIPPTPCSHKKEQGEVGRPEAQNESRNTGAPKEPAPVGRGRSALAGRSKAGCVLPTRSRRPRTQVGQDARVPGMRARRPRSQAVQGHERFQRVRNTVFESLFRSRPRRRALSRIAEG